MGVLRWCRLAGALLPLVLATTPRLALAQEILLADRGPRFLLAASSRGGKPVEIQAGSNAMLRRVVSLRVEHPTVGSLLDAIERQTGLRFYYGRDIVSPDRPVSLRADSITVAAALMGILVDAEVDVLMSRAGPQVALVRQPARALADTGAIVGRVTAKSGSTPLTGATVVVGGTRRSATTGTDGHFRISAVPSGTYTVQARYIGYAPGAASVTVSADQEATADFTLEKSVQRLDEVVTTGTVVPTEVRALPTPISVVTADDIQQKGYQRVDQIFRGDVPGAVAWDLGAFNNTSLIMVRGASSIGSLPRIKTFIDGVEVADAAYVANIDPSSIDRIEVIRGPEASTLYGAEALSGVMQIFTKKGRLGLTRPEVEGKASVGGVANVNGGGTKALTDNSAAVLGGSNNASYSLGGTYRHTGEWLPAYGAEYWNVSSGAQITQGPFTISGSARYSENTHDDPWNIRFQAYFPFSKPANTGERVRQQTFGATAGYQATRRWRHTLSIGYDRNYDIQYQTTPRLLTPADSFLFVSTGDQAKTSLLYHTDLSLELGRAAAATVTAGVDYYSYDYQSAYTSGATKTTGFIDGSTSPYHVQWTNTGYFAQAQVGLEERLFLTGGVRAERNPNFGPDLGTAFSPRAGVAYVTPAGPTTLKLRASYGESIRPPSIGASTASQTAFGIRLANPNLGPERQRGADGGVDLYFGQRVSLGVTYYNQRAIDLIDLVTIPTPPGTLPTSQSQNVGRVKNEGWEFEGQFAAGPIRVSGTYSITHSTVQQLSPTYTGDYQPGDRILGIPRSSAGATVIYTPFPRTTLSGSMSYIGRWTELDYVAYFGFAFGGQPYRGSTRAYWIDYPAVTKFAVSIGQELTNQLGVFARAENVGNTRRYEANNFNNVTMPRSVTFGLNFHY